MVKYLARYGRGGPLKNTPIRQVTETHVTYRFEDSANNGQPTDLTVSSEEFIRRYLQHIPAPRQQVVRSFGLYASTIKTETLSAARACHDQAPLQRPVFLTWQAFTLTFISLGIDTPVDESNLRQEVSPKVAVEEWWFDSVP